MGDQPAGLRRRDFLKAAGAVGVAGAVPLKGLAEAGTAGGEEGAAAPSGRTSESHPPAPQPTSRPGESAYVFFTAPEAALVSAAIDRILPSDDTGPGGVEVGVVWYIDRQLAGAFGRGYRMYLNGPWPEAASPSQGYQLPLAPAELYRLAIADIDQVSRRSNEGKAFADLAPPQQEAMLQSLDKGELKLDTVPGKVFFDLLLANAFEGYFGDPAYGGNREMAVWKMIGFPGARGAYADDIVLYRNKPFTELPVNLADLQ